MGHGHKFLKRDYIVRAAEDSLRRLSVDAIDLYQSHWDDDTTPFEETLEAYAQLMRQGKVQGDRRVEPRCAAPRAGARGKPQRGPAALRDAAAALQPVRARELRRTAAGPVRAGGHRRHHLLLARGRISHGQVPVRGGLRQERARAGDEEIPESARATRSSPRSTAVAARGGATPSQVALAWLMTRPAVVAPIASATTVAQLDEIMAATRLTFRRGSDACARRGERAA